MPNEPKVNGNGHAKHPEQLSLVDQLIARAIGNGVALGAVGDPVSMTCPTLWDWISRVKIKDEWVKTPARITIQLTPGGVAVAIMDTALCTSMDVACTYLDEAFGALEKVITGPNPPLRVWDSKDPAFRKKRKDLLPGA